MLATQDSLPTLQDVLRLSKYFSSEERLYLAKKLLDSLVTEDLSEIERPEDENSETIEQANNSADDAIVSERKAFIDLHSVLLQQYPGEHVAIYGGELVDHDKDALKLSLRISRAYPNEFVWMAPMKETPLEEWAVRSPRFEPIAE